MMMADKVVAELVKKSSQFLDMFGEKNIPGLDDGEVVHEGWKKGWVIDAVLLFIIV